MKLQNKHLLRNFQLEAGRYSGRGADREAMNGWEDPSCQLRGQFLGHWLSAAALHYEEVKDNELKAKAEAIVKELETPTLAEFGIDKEEFFKVIDKMAFDAMDSGSPQNTMPPQ